jgi:hypothetical protein
MVLASSYVPHVLWNSNTLRLSELAVLRTLDFLAPTVPRLNGSRALRSARFGRSWDWRSQGVWGAMRQRFMELEVPEALRSISVLRLFGVEVLEAFGGVEG